MTSSNQERANPYRGRHLSLGALMLLIAGAVLGL